MKRKLLIASFVIICSSLQAQVSLEVKAVKEKDNLYQLTFSVTMDKGFHLYGSNPRQSLTGPQVAFTNAEISPLELNGEPPMIKDPVFENKAVKAFTNTFFLKGQILINGSVPGILNGTFNAYAANGNEFVTIEKKFTVALEGGVEASQNSLRIPSIDVNHPLVDAGENEKEHSAIAVFFLGMIGGLLALLTPCVFPMIPVTVSFFTSKASSKKQAIQNGMLYGLFILSIYLCASLPFHLLRGLRPELLNNIATSAPLNVFFFIVFLFFAISFFGAFDLSLPSSVATRAGKRSGIFFMALTLCIVSFSCTGPILGSLLVGSLSGGAWLLTAGLAGFGVALALPFGLFAVFPQALKRLPRSGAWLDSVKKVLAFIELALAFKFLSNADLVMHWGILKREVFLSIWILIMLGLIGYLIDIPWLIRYGKLKFTPGKTILSIFVFAFTVYLCTGLFGKSLTLLSGFPPPMSYSIYQTDKKILEADVINDYDKALETAKRENKKLLIDFTGWACVNCRKMEEKVWTDPAVASYIKEHFVLLSLYVDDKKPLPVEQRNDSLQTVGDKWAKFQTLNFSKVSQPLYAVLNGKQELLTVPVGYTPDAIQFLNWLKKTAQ